jgi:zinc protease
MQVMQTVQTMFLTTVAMTSAPIVVPIIGLISSLTVGCASTKKPGVSVVSGNQTAKAEMKEIAKFDSKTGFRLPPYQEKHLANGLTVFWLPDDKLPFVSYSLLMRVGSTQDPRDLSGLSAMVAELVDKGTKKRNAQRIAAELGQMGAELNVNAMLEYTVVSGSALSNYGDVLLDNMVEILMEPTFADVEIERVRKQVLAAIEHRLDDPDGFSDLAFSSFLYGDHPYSRPIIGNAKSVVAIKKKHIISHYLRYYRPSNSILTITGKYTPELEAKILNAFGSWQGRESPKTEFPQVVPIKNLQVELVDKPGLVQAQIRIGHLGIKRTNPDFIPIRVANTILGGAFASRLSDRVRKELGLTYSIRSAFDPRLDQGPFEIATFTKNSSVGQALEETLRVYENFHREGVRKDEVEMVKGYLRGIFPTAIETPEKLALNLMLLRFYGVPDTYLTSYLTEVDQVSVTEINRVIKKYFEPRNLKILVYSNAADIQAQLEPLTKSHGGELILKKANDF